MNFENYVDELSALQAVTERLKALYDEKEEALPFNLALSGGETAKKLFAFWVEKYKEEMDWNRFRFFWVDERCVPPTDNDSNFGHADSLLLKPMNIKEEHVFRIHGEDIPEKEALRYSQIITNNLPVYNGLPHFDCIILGVGADAHTASIFPNAMSLLTDARLCAVSRHPKSGQLRITLTGPMILNHVPLLIPVLGSGKDDMIATLKIGYSETNRTPAAYVLGHARTAFVFTSTSAL